MRIAGRITALAVAGTLATTMLVGATSAQAAIGPCEDSVGYAISSPSTLDGSGDHTVVIGLSPLLRTVRLRVAEDSGCTLEAGDRWSVRSAYFYAAGTYDGTAASLTDTVLVSVPRSDAEVGLRPVEVTLADASGTDNDLVAGNGVYLKRRTAWRSTFNVYYESPAPTCGVMRGTTLRAQGQFIRASWSLDVYRPYTDRPVRLLSAPGTSATHEVESTVATAVTNADGWAYFSFRPAYDATYFAHYGGNVYAGHADSLRDFVDCAVR